MKVVIHKLFEYLLETTAQQPECVVGLSLARPPVLADYLPDLDPRMSLDWNNVSFQGLPALREHVLAQAGLERLQPGDVLITAGAAEANFLAIMQLVQPGDEMVIEQPGWPQAAVLARAIGVKTTAIVRREDQGWALPLDALDRAITPRTKLIFLTNPNNPTGALLRRAEIEHIAGLADRVGAWLLVDEVYAGLEWAHARAPSVAGLYARGITTGSVSKSLGLQGLRIGWLVCADPGMIRDALILRENSSEIMNVVGEAIAEIALRPDRYARSLAAARAEGAANLALLDAFIADEPRLSWQRPQGGLIGLARVAGMTGETLARRLLAERRTFLLPGSAYDEPDHIRVGVGGGPGVNLAQGLDRLRSLLAQAL